jgi:hypothetical protein
MYRVLCRSSNVNVRTYYVFEATAEEHSETSKKLKVGYLYWQAFLGRGEDYDRPILNISVFNIERTGGMKLEPVLPEEAEAITGLHMPAAMDRLRELVHESGGS